LKLKLKEEKLKGFGQVINHKGVKTG